jgi:hypothetical protein
VPPVVSAASVSLLVVGAGWRNLLRSCPEAAMVPAEGGCSVAPGGDLLFGRRFLGTGSGYLVLVQGSLELVRRWCCLALSAATWRERSSISCRSVVLLGVGPTLASGGWDATSEMRSAQRAAASKLHSC